MPFDYDEALRTTRDELERRFHESPAGAIPVGRGAGTVLLATAGPVAKPVNRVTTALFWRGKHFEEGELRNLLTPLEQPAIRARVYEAPSLTDGEPCIVLDYSTTSTLARFVRDEIREVSPGNYLGIVFVNGRRAPVDFFLSFEEGATASGRAAGWKGFRLEERPVGWQEQAPVRIVREFVLPVPPALAFERLADIAGWSSWFDGMRRVRIDGAAKGVGALRTVWVGLNRVQERFSLWEEGERLVFSLVAANLPGLRAMQEDWRLRPEGEGARLSVCIGVEPWGPLRRVPDFVQRIVSRSTRGAEGITRLF